MLDSIGTSCARKTYLICLWITIFMLTMRTWDQSLDLTDAVNHLVLFELKRGLPADLTKASSLLG